MIFLNVRVVLFNLARPLEDALALAAPHRWLQRLGVVEHPVGQFRQRHKHRRQPCPELLAYPRLCHAYLLSRLLTSTSSRTALTGRRSRWCYASCSSTARAISISCAFGLMHRITRAFSHCHESIGIEQSGSGSKSPIGTHS